MEVRWKVIPSAGLALLAFTALASASPMDELVAAAKTEGELTVIALPRDWCGYGGIIDGFKAKFGLMINEVLPDAGSATEIDAIKKARDTADPQTPDVIDVGLSFAASAKRDGLLQPYKVAKWATIPDAAKDADGHWYGGYYGTIAFEVNADVVAKMPTDWADLVGPDYKNRVGLAGDLASNQAILGIFAAGLSAANGNVGQAADQGLRFFANLNRKGNFVPVVGNLATLTDGRTPILVRWDYLAKADREQLRGKTNIEIIRPKTGVVGGIYVQAISAFAPHPNAARLWMEHLYSDETQLAFHKAHCYPIRLTDLVRTGKVPAEPGETLAQFRGYGRDIEPFFPTIEEQEKAREIITKGWDGIVGTQIQCLEDNGATNIPMALNETTIGQCPIPQ
ncbi:putative spermidine/putrescine transport system substrate-binding protein [Rhizobium sp. BK313]|uniref:ABC transporter substrate-binding protein n=1 Tax=Rhizobium sp. BK313 TaxID=2587081 RepID=UPI001062227D|nr:extracellular solute-binding protein [Rhizobium sp. BK313]MBB3459151.1 putative spermidine/putrescine transport system substrate-binding protein [Rhizobium sp. BK313]